MGTYPDWLRCPARLSPCRLCALVIFLLTTLLLKLYYSYAISPRSLSATPSLDTLALNRSFLPIASLEKRLPTSLIIGVRKAGTRSLLGFLEMHPSIVTCHQEVHFFDRNETYANGLEWYRQQMPISLPDQITMEKSPAYFHEEIASQRIHDFNPKLRLLLIVRDPVVRVVSDWLQLEVKRARMGERSIPLEREVLRSDGSINTSSNLIKTSLYSIHYKRWVKVAGFSPSQILVVDGDRFTNDPVHELTRVEQFLELPAYFTHDMFYYNATKGFYCKRRLGGEAKCLGASKGRPHPPLNPRLRRKLYRFFSKFNERFFNMLGVEFDWDDPGSAEEEEEFDEDLEERGGRKKRRREKEEEDMTKEERRDRKRKRRRAKMEEDLLEKRGGGWKKRKRRAKKKVGDNM